MNPTVSTYSPIALGDSDLEQECTRAFVTYVSISAFNFFTPGIITTFSSSGPVASFSMNARSFLPRRSLITTITTLICFSLASFTMFQVSNLKVGLPSLMTTILLGLLVRPPFMNIFSAVENAC